jgi:hypothetical protein
MKVAVVGSRNYPDEGKVNIARLVSELPDETILVSGGARGVDEIAEKCHAARGGRVFSFRVRQEGEQWGVEFWDFGGAKPQIVFFDDFFATKKDALFYRNTLIAHECDEMHAFWNGYSKGTLFTTDFAQTIDKPVTFH